MEKYCNHYESGGARRSRLPKAQTNHFVSRSLAYYFCRFAPGETTQPQSADVKIGKGNTSAGTAKKSILMEVILLSSTKEHL